MQDRDVHIVYSVDYRYVIGSIVSATSLRRHLSNPNIHVVFHVAHPGLSDALREELRLALQQLGSLHLYDVSAGLRLEPPKKYFTTATLGRLQLATFLPDGVDRVIYLDADTLVLSDISVLVEVYLGVGGVGAVVNEIAPNRSVQVFGDRVLQSEYGARPPGCLNSGVLVIDVRTWRANHMSERAEELWRRFGPQLRGPDQDILNILLEGRWTELSPEWNKLITVHGSKFPDAFDPVTGSIALSGRELRERENIFLRDNPARMHYLTERRGILHYAGQVKPWQRDFPDNELLAIYREYWIPQETESRLKLVCETPVENPR